MSEFNPVWKLDSIEIGVSATSATPPVWTYAVLCKGIKSMTLNMNENNVQQQYLCGDGFAHNEVTGAAPEIDVTGDRVVGDTAQDYIAGLQFKIGPDRESMVKVTHGNKVITVPCVISDIVTIGGNAVDLIPFNCKIRFNGKPTVTDAPANNG